MEPGHKQPPVAFTIRLSRPIYDSLAKRAERAGVQHVDIVRMAVAEYLGVA